MNRLMLASVLAVAAAGSAQAAVTVTYSTTPTTYATTLNFDEVGGPTGSLAPNAFASQGVSNMTDGGGGGPFVGPGALVAPFLGTDNMWIGAGFGAFMNFSSPLTNFSCQYWDDSGPASPFAGGAIIVALSGGMEVGSLFVSNPTYSSSGPTWVDISATGGMTFDEVRLVGFGFVFPQAHVDDLSWNAVPAPASAALLGLGGLAAVRRRRAN